MGIKKICSMTGVVALLVTCLLSINIDTQAGEAKDVKSTKVGGGYAVTGELGDTSYMAEIYDATNSLPASESNFILADNEGYMWLCGYSGVIKFDGSSFVKQDTSEGMTNGRVIFQDSKGKIWVGTNDNGVVVIDDGVRTHFTFEEGLPSSSIRTFAEDDEGNVFIGTTQGIAYVTPEMKVVNFDCDLLNTQRILRLSTGKGGIIYGYTKKGDIFSVESKKLTSFYKNGHLGINKITNVYADPINEGKAYIGTEYGYLYYGNFGTTLKSLEEISLSPLKSVKWITEECGYIWVASETEVGYINQIHRFVLVDKLPLNSSIEMFTSDYQGNLWFASSRQGVMKIVANNFINYTEKAGIEDRVVNATCYHKGTLYVGTDEGLYIIDKNLRPVTNEMTEFIGDNRVRCIIDDEDGNVWFAVFSNNMGLIRLSANGEISSFRTHDGLPSNEIRCLRNGFNGNILVGTNEGVAIINDGELTLSMNGEILKTPVVLDLLELEDGTLYVATDGDGIYVIKDGVQIDRIGHDEGLTSDVVMRMNKDSQRDVIWITTSNSIEYMKDGKITNVSTFPYTHNFDIYSDNDDELWILASCGIFSVPVQQMLDDKVTDYREYNLANGLTSMPIANERSDIDVYGNLYVAGMTGVSKVNINRYHDANCDVRVGIASVTCDDVKLEPDETGTYVIPPDVNRIQISPAVMDYSMMNPVVKVFFDKVGDGGMTSQRSQLHTLDYTGLKYGDYVLHIQILDNVTGEIRQDETFKFIKQPRLFERTSVRILLIFLLAAAVAFIVWRIMTGTVIRRQYVEIQMAKDEAERANTAKSRFLANMSHEIRTPINTIMGMNEIILREDTEGVPKSYFMSVVNCSLDIRNAAESLLGLINEILDISKIESGKMHLVEQEYEPEEQLRSIISMIKVKSQQKDLTFDWEIDNKLPKKLYGDAGKVKQIILNLLTNAVKYTEQGGFTLKVTVESKSAEDCAVRISVKDTGIGVKTEDLDKLFTAYERLDEEKNSSIQGTGLGLDISRRFAELMNGKLWCESEYGKGSEFIFTFSQKVVDADGIGEFKEHEEYVAKGPYVPKFYAPDAKVLVVDDNTMNLAVFKGLIKPTKVQVETATSGLECLEKVKSGNYDIVFLDHMMPGMDGLETFIKLREINKDVPVYALTANTMTDPYKFYESKGFNGYLAKPIDTEELEYTMMYQLGDKITERPASELEKQTSDEFPENMAWIKEVDGISIEDGIKGSGGINAFINSIELFFDTIDENTKVLEDAYNDGDFKLYTIKTHALKSSARITGAMELSAFAEKMEKAGKSDDIDYITAHHEKLLNQYRLFKDKLKPIKDISADSSEDNDLPEVPENKLAGAYSAMREIVPQMDHEMMEMIISELKEYKLPAEDAEKIDSVSKMVKRFDWDGIEELLK
ncbi:ATP-binding protein [Butyrivibrio fibrisolvens]|uniref:hybrid sensor histidine kinase/response regulator n=1 Tax=Pseudobutyrivibrio ruminis TaxID=46206 RepID=UPI0003F9A440|nr:ATP-binding protein [Pseudobutyrivibrio ruminis]MDC7280062.1 ATP-binding protein [Butyrivibrio fibrisolvens]